MSLGSDRFDRRTVLKGIGASALVAGGLGAATGGAAAAETKRHLATGYADERRLAVAFEQHGAGLRETLVSEGIVDESFEFGDLDFEIHDDVTGLEATAADRRAGVNAIEEEGTFTALGMVSTSTESHEIALFVQPERDEAYAMVEPKDASGDGIIANADGVTPQGCSYISCGSSCGVCYDTQKTYNCDPSCNNCSVWDTDCGCCTCDDPYC